MKIKQNQQKCRCEMHNCTNEANFVLEINRSVFPIKIKICKTHLNELYEILAKEFVPKGLKNIIKKGELKIEKTIKEQ